MLKTIPLPPRKYVLTYYRTLEVVTWLLRTEKLNKSQMFSIDVKLQNLSKTSKIRIVELLKTIELTLTTMQ